MGRPSSPVLTRSFPVAGLRKKDLMDFLRTLPDSARIKVEAMAGHSDRWQLSALGKPNPKGPQPYTRTVLDLPSPLRGPRTILNVFLSRRSRHALDVVTFWGNYERLTEVVEGWLTQAITSKGWARLKRTKAFSEGTFPSRKNPSQDGTSTSFTLSAELATTLSRLAKTEGLGRDELIRRIINIELGRLGYAKAIAWGSYET